MIEAGIPRREFCKNGCVSKLGGIASLCGMYNLRYLPLETIKARDAAIKCEKMFGYVNSSLLKEHFKISAGALHYNGGIKQICKELGLNYRMGLRYNPNDLIAAVKAVYEKYGTDIRQEVFTKETGYSVCAIKTAFGSYNNLLIAAGIPVYMHKKYSAAEIIDDVKSVLEEHNSTSCTVYRKYGMYSQIIIDRTFGSWNNLIGLLELPHSRRRYGKDRMISDLKSIYDSFGFLSKTIIDDRCEYSYEAVSYVFNGVHGIEDAIGVRGAFSRAKSTGQIAIGTFLDKIIGRDNYIEEATFDWLINPKSNRHMYFDFYLPRMNKAIEFQGEQHFKYTPYFHNSYEEFDNAQYRDNIKEVLAESNSISVIYITFKDKLTEDLVASKIFE